MSLRKCHFPLKEWRRIREPHPKSESHRRRHGKQENHKSGPLDSLEGGSRGLEALGRGYQLVNILICEGASGPRAREGPLEGPGGVIVPKQNVSDLLPFQ